MSIFEHLLAGQIYARTDSPVATGNVLDLTLAVGRGVVFAHQLDTPAKHNANTNNISNAF